MFDVAANAVHGSLDVALGEVTSNRFQSRCGGHGLEMLKLIEGFVFDHSRYLAIDLVHHVEHLAETLLRSLEATECKLAREFDGFVLAPLGDAIEFAQRSVEVERNDA